MNKFIKNEIVIAPESLHGVMGERVMVVEVMKVIDDYAYCITPIVDDKLVSGNHVLVWENVLTRVDSDITSNRLGDLISRHFNTDTLTVTLGKHLGFNEALKHLKANYGSEIEFKDVLDEILELYESKNHDYGNSFTESLEKRGLLPAIILIENKLKRIDNYEKTGKLKVKSESVRDNWIDIANYAAQVVKAIDEGLLE